MIRATVIESGPDWRLFGAELPVLESKDSGTSLRFEELAGAEEGCG